MGNKKRLFFDTRAPQILCANELIMINKKKRGEKRLSFEKKNALDEKDQPCILKLAKLFKVNVEEGQVTASFIKTLWKNIDIIPAALALQAAEESGWGTSRFVPLSNAMHGKLAKYILWSVGNVKIPKSLTVNNRLSPTDETYLSKDAPIYFSSW